MLTPFSHRRILRLLLFIGVLFVVAGCGRRETRVASGTRDHVLHLGNGAEPKDLDPSAYQAAIEYTILSALFEGLVVIANDGTTLRPGVAERWEISADGLLYTFHLRREAQWSDGTPVTSDDFLFSFRRLFTPSMAAATADWGFPIAGAIDFVSGRNTSPDSLGLRAPDPHRFEIRLARPAPYLLYLLGGAPFHPLPRSVVERHGGATRPGTAWTRPGNLVGNGPFVLKSWHAQANVAVTRNPHYWDRASIRLNEVRFYGIDNPDTEERAFRAGELHTTFSVPVTKLDGYRAAQAPELHVTPLLSTSYVTFNTTRPPLNDVRVRRALAVAIDRTQLINVALRSAGTAAHSMTRPGTGGYQPPIHSNHDPELARRLLAEAGHPGGRGLPTIELLAAHSNSATQLALIIQDRWSKELGVTVEIVQQESKARISAMKAKQFQAGLAGYFYGIQDAETILTVARSTSPSNDSGWSSAAFDRAFHAAEFGPTPAVRHAAFDEMERLIAAEVPYVPLYHENQCILVHADVRGWRDNPLYAIDWRELWLEAPRP